MWLSVVNNAFGIKVLDETDYDALDVFCKSCDEFGIINNSSFKNLKIDKIKGEHGQYWCAYHIPSNTMVSISGLHHLPLNLSNWSASENDNCWRLGFRTATLPNWRAQFSSGLGNQFHKGFELGHMFPLQVEEAKKRGAEKFIITTNSTNGGKDASGKMFKVDRVIELLAKKNIFKLVVQDEEIFYTLQNVWELDPVYWNLK